MVSLGHNELKYLIRVRSDFDLKQLLKYRVSLILALNKCLKAKLFMVFED